MYGIQMASPEASLTIDLKSPAPAYRQIVDQVRQMCVEGILVPGEALPSVRRLSVDLGVHHNTVAEAYRTLAQEGWVEVAQGRPVMVVERAAAAPRKEQRVELEQSFDRRLRQFLAEMRGQGLSAVRIADRLRAVAEEMEG